ncbi:twin-arginine translocase TatA/TatE family subunit [Agromyces seonyuensis]|uniref:Sec-independent protein translocase protein TatA n=1 Tax=Agromyces seonyuensis TaxID=2662446 RepID=A0A6I4P8S3_9MICO|nr:twin-arginine translocase TatA/TatE family subunit [Agromyces seonyuensis]MWC00368.1 twin-arginine translocase TatA/TatE family subunit [Agromyces seonyuensis]
MLQNLGGWHLVILLVIVLVVFGAAKLPALAKSIGQSARVLKGEMRGLREDDAAATTPAATAPATSTAAAPVGAVAPVAPLAADDVRHAAAPQNGSTPAA